MIQYCCGKSIDEVNGYVEGLDPIGEWKFGLS